MGRGISLQTSIYDTKNNTICPIRQIRIWIDVYQGNSDIRNWYIKYKNLNVLDINFLISINFENEFHDVQLSNYDLVLSHTKIPIHTGDWISKDAMRMVQFGSIFHIE